MGESISNQPHLFLTDQHNQDFHIVFGHQNKTHVQHFINIGSLINNLSHLQKLPAGQMIFFPQNWSTNFTISLISLVQKMKCACVIYQWDGKYVAYMMV